MSLISDHFNVRGLVEAALPRHFTYNRGKLGPARTFLTLVNMRIFGQRGYRRVLNELKDGLQTQLGWLWDDKPSPAALCKSRKKLTTEHCQMAFQAVYGGCSLARSCPEFTHAGRRIISLDGTRLSLPDSPELDDYFGKPSNQTGETGYPSAGLIMMWDVSSQQPVAFQLAPYKHSEPEIGLKLCDQLPPNSLLIADRGFPSFRLFSSLERRQQPYLIRITKTQWKAIKPFVSGEERDADIVIPRPSKASKDPVVPHELCLRIIKYRLPNGEDELLATNLPRTKEHDPETLGKLYTTRWRIETAFREMKVWHALENFSARHVLGIYQEVTAAFVFMLMVSEMEAKVRSEKKHLIQENPTKPLPDIRYNRLMIADAVVGLLVASAAGTRQVEIHLQRCIDAIWRNREKRRKRPSYPRKKTKARKDG